MAAAACNVRAADLMIMLIDTIDFHIRCVIYSRMQVVTLSSPAEMQCHPLGQLVDFCPKLKPNFKKVHLKDMAKDCRAFLDQQQLLHGDHVASQNMELSL